MIKIALLSVGGVLLLATQADVRVAVFEWIHLRALLRSRTVPGFGVGRLVDDSSILYTRLHRTSRRIREWLRGNPRR